MKSLYYAEMIWVPAAAMTLVGMHILLYGLTPLLFISLISGIGLWTFIEYIVHRALHVLKHPGHIRHHSHPKERLGPNWWSTALILTGLCIVLNVIFGFRFASGLDSGVLAGYSAYLYTHNAIHFTNLMPKSQIRLRHEAHHRGENNTYGVITTFWDWVLNFAANSFQKKGPDA